jgi:O-antigen/teichoic acid export membrane protein
MGALYSKKSRTAVAIRSLGSAGLLFAARALAVIYQLRFANHTFGSNFGGLIALLNQITFYILLAELGLAAATTSLLFEPVHLGDNGRVAALLRALQRDVRRIVFVLAPLSVVASAVLSLWLRKQVPLVPLLFSLLLTCMSALMTFMALPYQSHFNASDRVPIRNVILACGFTFKVVLGIVLAKAMHSFIGLPLGTTLIGVVELLVQRWLVMPSIERQVISDEMIANARHSIHEKARFVVAHRVGYLFIYQSDYIILLLSSSLSLLGYYAQYQYIYAGLLSFSIAVGGTLTARIAKRQIDAGRQAFPVFYRKTSTLIAAAALLCGLGFYLFADLAIRILYKSNRFDHKAVLLFAVLLMLNIVKINDDLWIDTTGFYHKGYYLPILEAITYVALGLFLVRHFEIPGILYAGIVTNLLFSVTFKAFIIGGGVMDRKIPSTFVVKLVNLTGIGLAFYLFVSLIRLLPFLSALGG